METLTIVLTTIAITSLTMTLIGEIIIRRTNR